MSYMSVTIHTHTHTHTSVCSKLSLQLSTQSTHICIAFWLLHSTDCSSHQWQDKTMGLYFIAVPSMATLLYRKPTTAETSHDSCGAQGYDTGDTLHIIANIVRLLL